MISGAGGGGPADAATLGGSCIRLHNPKPDEAH